MPVKDEWQGYTKSLKQWIDSNVAEVFLIEERLVDKMMGHCGQMDLIAELRRQTGMGVVDWKTSESVSKTWSLQVMAYIDLAKTNGFNVQWGVSVRPKKDGTGCLPKYYHKDEWPYLRNMYRSHLNAWRFHHN